MVAQNIALGIEIEREGNLAARPGTRRKRRRKEIKFKPADPFVVDAHGGGTIGPQVLDKGLGFDRLLTFTLSPTWA